MLRFAVRKLLIPIVMPERARPSAPLIAVVGCDGSGKSTVCAHLSQWLQRYGPVAYVHLGKQAGNALRAVEAWPLVGPRLHRALHHRVKRAKKRIKNDAPPGLFAALVISAFLIRRMRRFRRMLALRQQGFLIVADRFPQVEDLRGPDSPALPISLQGGGIVGRLARRERREFDWMVSHQPDLVVRLNVDWETACARKPDHAPEELRRKVAVMPALTFGDAPIVEIDTVQPLERVLRAVEDAVAPVMAAHGYRARG